MDQHSVEGLELTEQTHLLDMDSFGDPCSPLVSVSGSGSVEDDDVVFIESALSPISAPAIANERNSVVTSSKHEKPQGSYSIVLPSSKDLASQKGNICETIVIDDDEDIGNEGEEKNSANFTEWGPFGKKNSPKDLDFFTSSFSRSKTKTGVGPFNPGRINVADVLQNGRFATHHNPDSWISQSASFPRNQKQPGMDSLSTVASLPKKNFQSSAQEQPTKPAQITCAYCKNPLQKGQTAYQRKGSDHLFCSTTCLSSFSRKRTRKTRNITCKKDAPTKKATASPMESSKSLQEFCGTSLSPCEDNQNFRKGIFNKSRCTICNKLGEIRHEVSVNNITHKLCSNHCFNEYRMTNGLIMNCCEHCGVYMPNKNTGNNILIGGQQKRFCCQNCVDEYKEMMETKSNALALENRKRNAIREENAVKLCESNILSEKIEEIPEKKKKTSEIEVSAQCNPETVLNIKNVNLLSPESDIAGKFQEQLEDTNSEDPSMSDVLSLDPGTWPRILNIKQRDSLVEHDPPQVRNFNFPKDSTGRRFSETYYTRILPSGEKTTRSWLLYSASKDSVFCLYCKLFGEGKNQLKNENGCKDWQHLSHILSKHEESEMHISNSVTYSKLKADLQNNKIDEIVEHRLYEDDGVLLFYT